MSTGNEGTRRYAIGVVLGEGGMGVVYAAHDAQRGHEVALKRLSARAFASAEERERATALFEREYHTLSQLVHPHVIAVYDYGIDADGPYYTMERLSGDSLKARAPLPWVEACKVVRDAASALAFLHSRRLVHRDVTPANIQLAQDGRAKLIDFGAMVPVGPARQVVGTPPFVAPECLALQVLDARADIFALGACLYFAITGRHAYPARRFAELPAVWSKPVVALSQLAPDVPETLDRLVLEMLSFEAAQRPRDIGEVFERLTAIAGLPRVEGEAAARAYLTHPELIGRENELRALRACIRRAARGRGQALLVQGDPGAGRSRLLDAAGGLATLAGFTIVRANAAGAPAAPLRAARSLLESLRDERPQLAPQVDAALALLATAASARSHEVRERARAVAAFGECFAAAGRQHGLALVIDDIHAFDEPSAACIASLATRIKSAKLLLIASAPRTTEARASSALVLLGEASRRLALAPLDHGETRAFFASLFGEVPHIELLAEIARRTLDGQPRHLMDGAQALLDRGLARYEGGHWLIASDPGALEAALASAADVHRALSGLSPDAADLLGTLALDRDANMRLPDFPALTAHGDSARVHRALTELLTAQVLAPFGDRFEVARESWRDAVAERMDPAERRARHKRLAERCAMRPLPRIYEAYHYVCAGLFTEAVAALEEFVKLIERQPDLDIVRNPVTLETLEAILAAPASTFSRVFRVAHGAGYAINAMYRGQPERVAGMFPHLLAELSFFSGIADYHALTDLPDAERLTRALTLAQERCVEAGRAGFDVITAIRRQGQVSLATAVCANFMADPELLDAIPDLRPYAPLSPALGMLVRLIEAVGMFARGRTFAAWDVVRAVYTELRTGDFSSVDPMTRVSLERTALGYLCSLESEHATDRARQYIDEYAPAMPNLAESYLSRHHYARGELEAAESARRRFEVLSVQANSLADARIVELPVYLSLYAAADDLMGLTRTLHALEQVVRTRPRWQARVRLARSHVLRCRGEHAAALSEIEASLASLEPNGADFAPSAALHVSLLCANGRARDAQAAGERYLAVAREGGLQTAALELALAEACAVLAEPERAEQHFASAYGILCERGTRGVHLARCLAVGARIAELRGDRALAEERRRERAEHAPAERRSAGRRRPLRVDAQDVTSHASTLSRCGTGKATFRGALRRLCNTSPSFCSEALQLLCDYTDAAGGALYLAREGRIEPIARTPGLPDAADLDGEIAAYLARDRDTSGECTVVATSAAMGEAPTLLKPRTGACTWVPYRLYAERDGDSALEGIAVLAFGDPTRAAVPHEWLSALADALAARPPAANAGTRRSQTPPPGR